MKSIFFALRLQLGCVFLFPFLGLAQQIAYPDLQVMVPTSEISVGHPTSTTRELRFSHITWNGGSGPMEIRPNYNGTTGVAQGYQRLYTYDSSGNLTPVQDVPIAIPMPFVAPSDYRFALAQFGLYFDSNGSLGALASMSPKVDFCMTEDYLVGGLPHTPPSVTYDPNNCSNPSGILGLSVGWGDKYDYTDNGENIDITSLPDAVYWLRAVADPYHLLLDSNPGNNITDTRLRITGDTVTIMGQQTHPNSTPPTVTITSPISGSTLSGSVVIMATATDTLTSVQSVQFLVDGNPLPGPVTSIGSQYSVTWNTAGASGTHFISAQATASVSGFVGTATPVTVTVSTQIGSLVLDQTVNVDGTGGVTPPFSTPASNELLLALVGADGPNVPQSQSLTVSGANLNWSLIARGNTQMGSSEIWAATAPSPLTNVTVSSAESQPGYNQSLTVLALHGTSGLGAHATGSGSQGSAPAVSLTTTRSGSAVIGVGNDWDNAIARSLGSNQQLLHQWLNTSTGDTYWDQATSATIPSNNTLVTLNDTAPTSDRWNFSAVEILAAGSAPPADTNPPTVNIINPVANQVLSGTVTVAATATDDTSVSSVAFSVDGQQLSGPVTSSGSQYSISWDTTKATNGNHTINVVATDSAGLTNAPVTVTVSVSNPPPVMACFVVDATAFKHGPGPVTTPAFKTALPSQLLLAFASSDGPSSGGQTLTVSGAGLTWTLVKRANAQAGTAEIWMATTSAGLTNATVTAKQAKTGYDMSLYVIAVEGSAGVGASAANSGSSGPPTVTLNTTKAGSLIYGVGNDWDNAVQRAVGTNQIIDDQWLDTATGDSYWVQNETYPPPILAGSPMTLNDTAPTKDRWNFVSVEILGD
jgi:hypothetical protein